MANRVFVIRSEMLKLIEELEALDIQRDEPIVWEKIHMVSSACIGYGLALRRCVDPEIASAACTLHDIGRVYTGKQKGHAEAGYEFAKAFLVERCGQLFADPEIEQIAVAVSEHSNKGEVGTPLCEVVKDADVLDLHYYGIKLPRPDQQRRLDSLLEDV